MERCAGASYAKFLPRAAIDIIRTKPHSASETGSTSGNEDSFRLLLRTERRCEEFSNMSGYGYGLDPCLDR